jgi:DNA-binding CsgD family transcriptional regulator/tetratricopeptide (TPR) repeat protein
MAGEALKRSLAEPWSRVGGRSSTIDGVHVLEREGALNLLDDLLGEAALGRGRLVVVRGEAGIGKSTLVEAFASGRSGRVLRGMCDPVVPARPLAPIFDIAEQVGGVLMSALDDPDRHRIQSALLGLLRAEGGPRIVVLEDVQWADEATLDVLTVIGRRSAQLRALVIATVRDDEVGPDHPLSVALGDIPTACMVSVTLEPLSIAAVAELAAESEIDAITLHRVTGGNPFFVTEVLASGGAEVPTTVRDAVWARSRRLSSAGLRVLRAASVLGPRCDAEVLCILGEAEPAAVDECVTAGMLRSQRSVIEFRHELSRLALLESLAPSERSRLHQRALSALREQAPSTDVAELARHAVEAGDAAAVLDLAAKAGAQASALSGHRAAAAYYESAVAYAAHLSEPDRAALLAAYAYECFVTNGIDSAIEAQVEALAASDLAEYLWWNGETQHALNMALEAVEVLESISPDATVGRAYARVAQVSMLSGQHLRAIEWSTKAVRLGDRFGDEAVVVHALNTLGTSELSIGINDGWSKLEESLERAMAADLEDESGRALNNLIASTRENRRYDLYDRYSERAAVFFDARGLDASKLCLIGDVVESLMERGKWNEALVTAREVVDCGSIHGRVECLAVLGRLAARRGQSDAFGLLDSALELQTNYGGEATYPLRAARAEAAWLSGDLALARREIAAGLPAFHEHSNPWLTGEIAFWAKRLGVEWECPRSPAEPYAFYLDGHPEKAGAAWAALGCPYEEAQALAESDDEADMRRGLSIFYTLGAAPAARILTERLKAKGVRGVSRGPRPTTRANPAGLSDREVEVLVLVSEGLRNAEIAQALVVSTRTVDHHVSAILNKLDVRSRHEASLMARTMLLGVE